MVHRKATKATTKKPLLESTKKRERDKHIKQETPRKTLMTPTIFFKLKRSERYIKKSICNNRFLLPPLQRDPTHALSSWGYSRGNTPRTVSSLNPSTQPYFHFSWTGGAWNHSLKRNVNLSSGKEKSIKTNRAYQGHGTVRGAPQSRVTGMHLYRQHLLLIN